MNGETAKVIHLPSRGGEEIVLTKKQLAARLKRSERWVEIKVRDEGLPVLATTDRFGRRRYSLKAVEAWMEAGKTKLKPAKRADRLTALEREVADLRSELRDLRRTG